MAAGGYDWDAMLSSRAARRAIDWVGRAQGSAPSPQAPLSLEEIEGMIAVCEKRLRANPNNIYAMMSMGCHLVYIGSYMKAILLLDRLIGLDPKNRLAHAQRGAALLELGVFEDALEAFERARSCSPDPADPFNVGIALGFLGRKEEAGRMIKDAVARDPKKARLGLSRCDASRALNMHGPGSRQGLARAILRK